jgi:hypothetical protein
MVTKQDAKATKIKNEGTSGEKDVRKDDDQEDVPKGLQETSLKTKAGTARRTQEKTLGTPVGPKDIDNAAMMMFGIKGIVSDCETLGAGPGGSVVIKSQEPPLTTKCLRYLWNNTNSDRDKYNEDRSRQSLLPNTYERIADRWSGLRPDEPAATTYPFRTCTLRGSEHPDNPATKTIAWGSKTIQEAQALMNNIHKAANYGTGEDQKTGLTMCYGIAAPAAPA